MKISLSGTFNEAEFSEIAEFIKTFDCSKYEESYIDKKTYEISWYCNNGVVTHIEISKY